HDIKKYIEKGHTLIVAADEKTIQLGLEDLLPITSDKIGAASSVNVKIINTFTKDKDFGTTTMHIVAGPKENSIVYAVADDDSPLLSQQSLGEGTLFYYGIFDKSSDFKATQDYPIFWFTLLTNLLNTENIQDFNFKLSENPQFRHAGVFEIEGKMKAFNLLSEGESDIGKKSSLLEEDELAFAEKSYAAKAEYDLSLLLLFLGIGLLIFELFILKYRGEF
ncbi:MAG: hypothetical protein QF915_03900, partial [Candidatus Woesearchaeota archaeon]|nr:hypothetical protein [Candidatus Woesearchaeota archaeon]